MDFINFMRMLAPFADIDDKNVQVYDLSTEEGLKGYNEQLDKLEQASLDVLNSFGINGKEWVVGMRNLGQKIYEQNKKKEEKQLERKESVKVNPKDIVKNNVNLQRQEIDHSVEEDEEEKKFKKPSEDLNINQKLQLHKIVQEYVDTMIKPYNNGLLTNQQINDAYAGLYEFAAWVMNK